MLPSMLNQNEAASKTNQIISLAKTLLIALVFGWGSASYAQCTPAGDRYPSGVYNVIVTQGENTKTLRVIKR